MIFARKIQKPTIEKRSKNQLFPFKIKIFLKILKKSVAKNVRLFCATRPKIYAVFPSIGGCDAPRKVGHRYGPIGGKKRGAPLNGSRKGGA